MTKDRQACPYCFILLCKERGYETIPEPLDARMSLSFVWPELSMGLCTLLIYYASLHWKQEIRRKNGFVCRAKTQWIKPYLSVRRGRSQVSSGTPTTSTHPTHSNPSQDASTNISKTRRILQPSAFLPAKTKNGIIFIQPYGFDQSLKHLCHQDIEQVGRWHIHSDLTLTTSHHLAKFSTLKSLFYQGTCFVLTCNLQKQINLSSLLYHLWVNRHQHSSMQLKNLTGDEN